ncbi:LytTR family transcriptional regulator [Fulvivirga sp. 29W222]|uniref:LytTR family transcriptional regulator n=1 Tax=Fulvivirga marina TaxID=2494733 RepID=A0A937KET1_9BACT|nr:LytTR family DNA-binding domain-containing protein [Fulvivirga marina]MBL6447515.1 LytTR family transcriptional regulator [Fulvivirga marina]
MKSYVHIMFWLTTLILLSVVFAPYYSSFEESFYFVSMLMPVVTGTCYFFNYYLVPKFLLKRKYGVFVLYSIYMLVASLYLEMVVIMLAFIFLAEYSYNNMSPVSSDVFVLAITLYFVVFLFSFILLIRRTFSKERDIDSLKEEKQKYEVGQFTVRSERQLKSLAYDEVIYIESLSDYVKIHRRTGASVVTKEKISKLEERLPEMFIRIHRSFIVNKNGVTAYSKEEVSIGENQLPISRTYKNAAWGKLNGDLTI